MLFGKKNTFSITARNLWLVSLISVLGPGSKCQAADPPATRFSYGTLRNRAHTLAASEYLAATKPDLPQELDKLSYDDYQRIHFKPAEGPWSNEKLRFTFQCFHRGFIYKDPVRIHLVENGQVQEFPFSSNQFEYSKLAIPAQLPGELGFAGLRVLYPLNSAGKQDEVLAFLGASYFRVLGANQRYGASARGVAIDTAEPSGEEFPRFTDFWIEKPGPLDSSLRLYALLDGPSVTGAYQFIIRPGQITQVEVESDLFFRKVVKKLGLAPVTSMFLMGENRTAFVADFRPEVHDSDGLLVGPTNGEWLWRPLINPQKEHVVSDFPVVQPKGFGLLQRDRQFDHYQDLAGRYELRPSFWVEPTGNWGTGEVQLVEIPTPAEWNDNIVAYWTAGQSPGRGEETHFSYRLSACQEEPGKPGLLRVAATRITPQHDKSPPRFVIDFSAQDRDSPPADSPIETKVHATRGTIRNVVSEKNEVTGGWRSFFDLDDAGNKPVDLRLVLHKGSEAVSETWVYRYQPP